MKSFYFQHDYTARNDQRVLALRSEFGNEGYAVFFYILESMAENNGPLNRGAIGGLSIGYGVSSELLHKIIDRCCEIGLLESDQTCFWSKRMLEHLTLRKTLSDKGKEGAMKRWENGGANGGAIREGNAKERKGKERKGNNITVIDESITELFDWFGEKSNRPVRVRSQSRMSKLRSSLKVFSKDELQRSWAMMMDDTFLRGGNPSNKDYCDIDYALRQDKIEKYLQLYRQKYGNA